MSNTDPGHAPGRARGAAPDGRPGAAPDRGRRLVVALAALTVVLAATAISSAVLVIRHQQATAPGQLLRPSGSLRASRPAWSTSCRSLRCPQCGRPGSLSPTSTGGRRRCRFPRQGRGAGIHGLALCQHLPDRVGGVHRLLPPSRASPGRVVFAAVNVSPYHASVSDVAMFSREHQLTAIASCHFHTGPVGSTSPPQWPTTPTRAAPTFPPAR